MEQTLVIVKPDGLAKGIVGELINEIHDSGLHIVDVARLVLSKEFAQTLYEGERDASYFDDVVGWVSSAPVLLVKIQGPNAAHVVKWQIIGRYPDGLRGRYAENWILNVAHAPESIEAATREIRLTLPLFEGRKQMDQNLFNDRVVFALTGMSECGKSTVGKYLDTRGVPRLKIVRLFERVRDKWSPGTELYSFTGREEKKDPYKLWDAFIDELIAEMDARAVTMASIESLYGGGLGPYLKQRMGDHFYILYIDIPLDIRLQRQVQREGLANLEEAREMLLPRDAVKDKSGIPALKSCADEIIDNSGTLDDLYRNVDRIVAKYSQ